MNLESQLQSLETEVKRRFESQHADHDFDHILRVTRTALLIQEAEGGDKTVVKALALLHDISDHKLNGGIHNDGERVGREVMMEIGFQSDFIDLVAPLIDKISFKGSGVADEIGALELQIVRDADRLDAIGAIGIARAFHFGGARNRKLFQSDINPTMHSSFEDYSNDKSHTINHFYEKLLLLKDRMQTETGKRLASERHVLMENFLEAFKNEWFATTNVSY